MRHLALVIAVVSATALGLAHDANAAPGQPSPNALTVGPLTPTASAQGTMAAQTTSDPGLCFTTDPTTGKYVEDPATGHALVVSAICDEIKLTVAEPGDVQLCVDATDMDPLLLGLLDLDAAVYNPATDALIARADGLVNPECLTFRADAAGTYQALIVPFFSIMGSYTATFTWTAIPANSPPAQPVPVPKFQINGGGKVGSGEEGTGTEATFSELARTEGNNLGKITVNIRGVCTVQAQVTTSGTPTAVATASNGNQNGGVWTGIVASGKVNGEPATIEVPETSDAGEQNPKPDTFSFVITSGNNPPGCQVGSVDVGAITINSGNVNFHPTHTV